MIGIGSALEDAWSPTVSRAPLRAIGSKHVSGAPWNPAVRNVVQASMSACSSAYRTSSARAARLLLDLSAVRLDSADAEVELRADLRIGVGERDQPQDTDLALGEVAGRVGTAARTPALRRAWSCSSVIRRAITPLVNGRERQPATLSRPTGRSASTDGSSARTGIAVTGQDASCSSSCATLPSTARTLPNPRVPTTISSARRVCATLATT